MKGKPKDAIQCEYFAWTIYVRDGVYYANLKNSGYDRKRYSLGTKDWEEAQANLRELDLHVAVETGLLSEKERSSRGQNPSIENGWSLYLQYCDRGEVQGGVSASTMKRYRAVRHHHQAFCTAKGIQGWAGFDKKALQAYGRHREETAAYRTVYLEMTTLKGVNRWLIQEECLPEHCRLRMKLRKPQGTDTYCYSAAEINAMIAHCAKQEDLLWLSNVIVALAHTGMRIGELASLRWGDVDFESGTIRVADERSSRHKQKLGAARTTKGRRSRVIPIHHRLEPVLRSLERSEDGYVFRAQRGGRLRPRGVLEIFVREVIEPLSARFPTPPGEIGFADGRIHSFRHAFCSQAFLSGASESEVREWLGHADSKMVEHYRHLRSEDARRRMNSLTFVDEGTVPNASDSL